jgi:hypothetical protein
MKPIAKIAIASTVVGLALVGYKMFVPPKFKIISSSVEGCGQGCKKISGTYNFGASIRNATFDNSHIGGYSKAGRSNLNFGWTLDVNMNEYKVIFSLMKDGKLVKILAELGT